MANADDREVIEYTVRAPCRACGRLYVWPKGSRAPGGLCPLCLPPLDEQPRGRALELEPELAPDVGLREPIEPPAFEDRLCEGCRSRPAAGVLSPPGGALCVGCTDELLEHWLAWLDDPSHEWWPTDDPFASCRVPVDGWRSVELADGTVRA